MGVGEEERERLCGVRFIVLGTKCPCGTSKFEGVKLRSYTQSVSNLISRILRWITNLILMERVYLQPGLEESFFNPLHGK